MSFTLQHPPADRWDPAPVPNRPGGNFFAKPLTLLRFSPVMFCREVVRHSIGDHTLMEFFAPRYAKQVVRIKTGRGRYRRCNPDGQMKQYPGDILTTAIVSSSSRLMLFSENPLRRQLSPPSPTRDQNTATACCCDSRHYLKSRTPDFLAEMGGPHVLCHGVGAFQEVALLFTPTKF